MGSPWAPTLVPNSPAAGSTPAPPEHQGPAVPTMHPRSTPHPGTEQAAACSRHRQARGHGVGEEVRRGDEHQPFTPAEYKHFDKYL